MGTGQNFDLRIGYTTGSDFGTAGIIKANKDFVKNNRFFIVSADVLFDFDLTEFVRFHVKHHKKLSLALSPHPEPHRLGSVSLHYNSIVNFTYKHTNPSFNLIMAGLQLVEPDLLYTFPEKGNLEEDVLPKLSKQDQVAGFVFSENWFHISTEKELIAAQSYLAKNR